MKFASITLEHPKTIKVTYTGIQPSPEQFEDYLIELAAMVKANRGCAQIFDATHIRVLPADLRIRHGQWMKENERLFTDDVSVTALIVPHMLARLVMRGVYLIQKPYSPYVVVSTTEEALKYVEEMTSIAA